MRQVTRLALLMVFCGLGACKHDLSHVRRQEDASTVDAAADSALDAPTLDAPALDALTDALTDAGDSGPVEDATIRDTGSGARVVQPYMVPEPIRPRGLAALPDDQGVLLVGNRFEGEDERSRPVLLRLGGAFEDGATISVGSESQLVDVARIEATFGDRDVRVAVGTTRVDVERSWDALVVYLRDGAALEAHVLRDSTEPATRNFEQRLFSVAADQGGWVAGGTLEPVGGGILTGLLSLANHSMDGVRPAASFAVSNGDMPVALWGVALDDSNYYAVGESGGAGFVMATGRGTGEGIVWAREMRLENLRRYEHVRLADGELVVTGGPWVSRIGLDGSHRSTVRGQLDSQWLMSAASGGNEFALGHNGTRFRSSQQGAAIFERNDPLSHSIPRRLWSAAAETPALGLVAAVGPLSVDVRARQITLLPIGTPHTCDLFAGRSDLVEADVDDSNWVDITGLSTVAGPLPLTEELQLSNESAFPPSREGTCDP